MLLLALTLVVLFLCLWYLLAVRVRWMVGGRETRRTSRQRRGLFVALLLVVLSCQLVLPSAMSREDSLVAAAAIRRCLGSNSTVISSGCCHMCSRSDSPSVGCSRSELRSVKAPISAINSTSGHSVASSLSYKRDSVSLLGGCSTPISPIITGLSHPPCTTDEVLLHAATRTLRFSSASQPGSRVSPSRLVVNGPSFNWLWAWPSTSKEESVSQSIPIISRGFTGTSSRGLLLYVSSGIMLQVNSPGLVSMSPFFSNEKCLSSPFFLSMKGDGFLASLPSISFSFFTCLSSCIAVCMEPEDTKFENTSVFLVGESWLSTSLVTISRISDLVMKALSTQSSYALISLSSSFGELSILSYVARVAYVFSLRGWLIPSVVRCNKTS